MNANDPGLKLLVIGLAMGIGFILISFTKVRLYKRPQDNATFRWAFRVLGTVLCALSGMAAWLAFLRPGH